VVAQSQRLYCRNSRDSARTFLCFGRVEVSVGDDAGGLA
jgi:hypothetical protein